MPKDNLGIGLFAFGLILLFAGIFLVFYEQTIAVHSITSIEVSSHPFQLLGISSAILGIVCVAIGGYQLQKSPNELSETNVESPKPRVNEAQSHPPPTHENSWLCHYCGQWNPNYIDGDQINQCMCCGKRKMPQYH